MRTKRDLSARGLSVQIGKSPSYVSKIESDQLEPSLSAFASIVRALRLSDAEILLLVGMH